MKSTVYDHVPVWYELSTCGSHTIHIRISSTATAHLQSIEWDKIPIVKVHQSDWNLTPFIPPSELQWGFGEVLHTIDRKRSRNGWTVFSCVLPEMGTRTEKQILELRSTLFVLFTCLYIFEGESTEKKRQLLTIDGLGLETNGNLGQCYISATVTPTLCEWISKKPDQTSLKEVEEVMYDAYLHMYPGYRKFMRKHDFQAVCQKPGRISLRIPGDACDLSPDSFHQSEGGCGYKLSPHNIDNPVQQLTFLIGLARLHELARQ